MSKPIPITAAKHIAKEYGYEQVVILGRSTGDEGGGDHLTTYGINPTHCGIAGKIGATFKRWMGWIDDAGNGPEKVPKVRKPGSTEGMTPERIAEFTERPADGSFSEQEGEYYR